MCVAFGIDRHFSVGKREEDRLGFSECVGSKKEH